MRLRPGAIALALGAASACGPAPGTSPPRPDPVPGRIKRYQPLEMRSDAARPDQAVILGTDDANGSTVLLIPVVGRFVVVDAITMRGGARGAADAQQIVLTSAARTPGAPQPAPPLKINGTGEGAAGTRWRSGTWSAALVAAAALAKDAADVGLEATPAGTVDGAASALVAAGFVALLSGEVIDPRATLAGGIEPDGTIGPVAGLAEQVTAALAHGKTRIGYPSGMRIARSAAGKDVDLVQLARAQRAEAVELGSVADAVQLLSGRRMPAPQPVPVAAMALEPATVARLEARYLTWQHRLAEEWAPLLQLEQAGRMPATVTALLRVAHTRSERAESLRRAGKLPAAYGDMLAAWAYAAAANQTHAVVGKVAAGDVDAAEAALAALDPGDAGVRASFAGIAAARPTTIAGHLAMLEALEAALRGWVFHDVAADSLRTSVRLLGDLRGKPLAELAAPTTGETVAAAVAPTALRLLRTAAEATVAEQALALLVDPGAGSESQPLPLRPGAAASCSAANLLRVSAGFQAAAAAAVDHLDALVVEPLAKKLGVSAEQARHQVGTLEPDYRLAARLVRAAANDLPRELAASWGDDSVATGLLALAGARTAYLGAALVIARYESLGVHSGDAGRAVAVNHPPAFRAMLASAERASRAAAHAARVATGEIPVQSRLAYQLAAIEAAGDLDEQIDALAELWTATAVSEAAVMLVRNCT